MFFFKRRNPRGSSTHPAAWGSRSNRGAAALAGTDPDTVLQGQNKDLAVADLTGVAGARGVDDRFDGCLHEGVVDGNFELELGQEPHLELAAAINLGEPSLPAAAAHVGDRHEIDVG